MCKRLCILLLCMLLICLPLAQAYAAARGPACTFDELQNLLLTAHEGDVITIADDILCDAPLSSSVAVRITSHGDAASLSGAHLQDAQLIFSNIHLKDSLIVSGSSRIHLRGGTRVTGADGKCGVIFSGEGLLLADRGSSITGGSGACGVSIDHHSGELYAGFEGDISGGSGYSGGAGVHISSLHSSGVIMLSGNITGGQGETLGGHAVNLHSLSGNAFITVDGLVRGGAGSIGGDGIQIVAVGDAVNVGITGKVVGGDGGSYGGDAIMLMDISGASIVHLSGEFIGGDARGSSGIPGTSLVIVGDSTRAHTHVNNCLLLDGSRVLGASRAAPQITPLPAITSSAHSIAVLNSAETVDDIQADNVQDVSAAAVSPTAQP